MAAEFIHIGIPITNKKEGMVYVDNVKLWKSEDPDASDFKIEYLKFEEGTPFPEIMHKKPHIAFKVDDLEPYVEEADRLIFGPLVLSDTVRIAFIIQNETIIELFEEKA